MGGSVQVENQFSHDNLDENANDQSKHRLDPKIGTENPKGPESECEMGVDSNTKVTNLQCYHLIPHYVGKHYYIKNIWKKERVKSRGVEI